MDLAEFNRRFYHLRQVSAENDFPLREAGKPAAVLIPLVKHKELSVLFTIRAKHLNHHAGQISFPGGRWDDTDSDLADTALRETEEEIGLHRDKIQIIGSLQPFRTISRYRVTPYIGLVDKPTQFKINPSEVDEIFEVPLKFLVDSKNHHIHMIKREDYEYPVYFIQWQDKMIWGATAAFIRTLSKHLL